jgi:hypothetical protein
MSEVPHTEFDDSYPTCVETYSTLRVFSEDVAPDEVTRVLQIEPTRSFRKGDSHSRGKLRRKANGWFYSTQQLCGSKDTRRHIDMILSTLEGKEEAVTILQRQGCKLDISSYWVSTGQGGPWLMPQEMLKLGRLGIEVWWDIYFSDQDET